MRKFNAFQGLRLFAFLNVFLLHVNGYRIDSFHNNAAWAVSFFIMISGFLYGYQYLLDKKLEIKQTLKFFAKKVLKFYPLYLLCLIAMIPFTCIVVGLPEASELHETINSLLLNVSLLQSWTLDRNISYAFTGVGWFMSTFVFLILITVPIIVGINKLLKKSKNKNVLLIIIAFITLLLAIGYTFMVRQLELPRADWLYIFPIGRTFEYIIAITLGMFVKNNEDKLKNFSKKKIIITILELLSLVMIVYLLKFIHNFDLLEHALAWIIPNIILLFIFSFDTGYVSKIIGNKLFVYLGSISFNMYIIHQVVNMYFYIIPTMNLDLTDGRKINNLLFILFFTIIISDFFNKNGIINKSVEKLKNKLN